MGFWLKYLTYYNSFRIWLFVFSIEIIIYNNYLIAAKIKTNPKKNNKLWMMTGNSKKGLS